MINKDLSKEKWCNFSYSYSITYEIHICISIIYDFCLTLQYDENLTMNKSGSSSSLLSIHDKIPPQVIRKHDSSFC